MKDRSDSDEELLEAARRAPEGDYQAFEQLVCRHQERVVANCRYLTRDPGYAEDLAQEIFVKVFFGMSRFEGRSSFRTWLQRIQINHCLMHLRKQKGKFFVDAGDKKVKNAKEFVVQPAAAKAMMDHSERQQITAILGVMSDGLRIPILMRDMNQLSYQEVADALRISLAAVKMRIKRGREEFRRQYSGLSPNMGWQRTTKAGDKKRVAWCDDYPTCSADGKNRE